MIEALDAVVTRVDEAVRRAVATSAPPIVVVHGAHGSGRTTICERLVAARDSSHVVRVDRSAADPEAVRAAVAGRNGTPTLVVVDDADLLDAKVRRAVFDVTHDASRAGTTVSVLTATDVGRLDIAPDAATWVESVELALADLATLVRTVRGIGPSEFALRRLATLTNGNLRTAVELIAALDDAQLRAGVGIDLEILGTLPHGRFVTAHLRALPPATQLALCLVAHGPDEPFAVIERVLVARGGSPSDLGPAEIAGWVDVGPRGVHFRHPIELAAARVLAPFAVRRDLVAALAACAPAERAAWYEAQVAAAPDDDLAVRLDHLASAELAGGRPRRAAEAWRLAAEFRSGDASDDLLRAAHAAHAGGDPGATAELAAVLVAEPRAAGVFGEARRLQGNVALWSGLTDAAYQLHRDAEPLWDDAPVVAASMTLQATVGALHHGHLSAAAVMADRTADRTRALGPLGLAARAAAGYCRTLLGDASGIGEVLAAAELHERFEPFAARDPNVFSLTSWVGRMLDESGAPDAALAMLSWTIERAQDARAPGFEVMPLVHRSALHLRRGRTADATRDAHRLHALVADVGEAEQQISAALVAARVEVFAGDDGALDQLRTVTARSKGPAALEALVALGQAQLAIGDAPSAIATLSRVESWKRVMRLEHPGFAAHRADLVEALVHGGEMGRAAELARVQAATSESWPDPFVRGLAARSTALVAPDLDAAEAAFAVSIGELRGASADFERARTLLCLGARRRRKGRRATARDPLREAADLFERLEAKRWAQRARAELQATGIGGAPRPPSGRAGAELGALSDRERRIAELVAHGSTNQEVAVALHLSRKTIENHLTRIYQKLGLRSRTELARAVDSAR
ncbi:MAG TPA: LuxR C-terminal-related transcriptional regulator [Acidimicrobiia bacterium]|nr:LuxR C-terminal-related transcriptional regulator [Acidimicrobiia bacterium]